MTIRVVSFGPAATTTTTIALGDPSADRGGSCASEEKRAVAKGGNPALPSNLRKLQGTRARQRGRERERERERERAKCPAGRIDNSIKCPLITLLIGPLCAAEWSALCHAAATIPPDKEREERELLASSAAPLRLPASRLRRDVSTLAARARSLSR